MKTLTQTQVNDLREYISKVAAKFNLNFNGDTLLPKTLNHNTAVERLHMFYFIKLNNVLMGDKFHDVIDYFKGGIDKFCRVVYYRTQLNNTAYKSNWHGARGFLLAVDDIVCDIFGGNGNSVPQAILNEWNTMMSPVRCGRGRTIRVFEDHQRINGSVTGRKKYRWVY